MSKAQTPPPPSPISNRSSNANSTRIKTRAGVF
jgi:hypothetical protein